MNLRAFISGVVMALVGVLLTWLATVEARVVREANMKTRAHRRGRRRERNRVVRRSADAGIDINRSGHPGFPGDGGPQPPTGAPTVGHGLREIEIGTELQRTKEEANELSRWAREQR